MLVNGRPEMVRRAVKAFEARTYADARLMLYDTSAEHGIIPKHWGSPRVRSARGAPPEINAILLDPVVATVGELRNAAIEYVRSEWRPPIIVHWDSDDWSHPNRIAEQVALLQTSGADCVGYREMLFWRKRAPVGDSGEALLYTNPEPDFCLGTSLCYWRSVWERKPFEALPVAPGGIGEDWKFQQGLKRTAVSSLVSPSSGSPVEPRMIASIHGGNTSDYSIIDNPKQRSFVRMPLWDEHCRKVMDWGVR